ncbi:pen c 1 [Apiospora rasikravindrae]|uniref:Pen c 1 n=1 Tax=Apiospora rasikravindrae TaxID=990691 RepID=A0ABR1RP25_9PEZI
MEPPFYKEDKDGYRYQAIETSDSILQTLSSQNTDSVYPPPRVFWSPYSQVNTVAIYVLEKAYDSSCFKGHDGPSVKTIKTGRFQATDLAGAATIYDATHPIDEEKHGVAVLNRIGSKHYGSCRGSLCNCYVVQVRWGKDREGFYDANQWEEAISIIKKHFKELKEAIHSDPYKFAILNISHDVRNTKDIQKALQGLFDDGFVVVAAAGNRRENLDLPKVREKYAPEANPNTILIGALDQDWYGAWHSGQDPTLGSNYGSRVDYWVRGHNVEFHEPNLEMSGTSHACPTAVGVIASMLSAGQITSTKAQDVRAYLDKCAVPALSIEGQKTKHLRNHSGLFPVAHPF